MTLGFCWGWGWVRIKGKSFQSVPLLRQKKSVWGGKSGVGVYVVRR